MLDVFFFERRITTRKRHDFRWHCEYRRWPCERSVRALQRRRWAALHAIKKAISLAVLFDIHVV
jgi:hypothetical protein